MLKAAWRHALHGVTNRKKQSEILGQIEKRLVLYEIDNVDSDRPFFSICPGIQTRMFYSEERIKIMEGEFDVFDVDVDSQRIYEWVAAGPSDKFLERDLLPLPAGVISDRFFPIPHFWRENHGELPVSSEEINNYVDKKDSAFITTDLGIGWKENQWSVYKSNQPKALEEIRNRELRQ